MNKKWIWISVIVIAILAAGGYYWYSTNSSTPGQSGTANAFAQGEQAEGTEMPTTIVRPATDTAQVSAAGNIEVASQYSAMLRVAGIVTEVMVEVGDTVQTGDVLLAMDTIDLERAVQIAQLNLASSQTSLDKLLEPADPAEIASAQASLASARENLVEVEAGPSAAELASAEATLAAAQERYQELLDGPSEAELTQLAVSLRKAELALQDAQDEYDRVAYRGDIGASQQAMALQEATIDYESAKAAYEESTEPASAAELQDALSSIENAKHQLETLRDQPTEAEIASAEAQVANAESSLNNLLNGTDDADIESAQISVQKAQLDLEDAQDDLAQAQLMSPIDGTVLAVDVEEGQKINTDSLNAVTLANLTNLELNVLVAEVDIPKVKVGQPVEIAIDALPGQTFQGTVSKVQPVSESSSSVVNYPVSIQLEGNNLDKVLPGMTAVATIFDEDAEPGWLVPSTSVREFEGEHYVMVVQNGERQRVKVTPGEVQGEWTVVQSPDLQAGDTVAGQVTSFINEDDGFRGFGPMGGGRRPD
jgi:RND family efflux transporter MFP subunit